MLTTVLVFVIVSTLVQNVHGAIGDREPDEPVQSPVEPSVMPTVSPVSFGTGPHWDNDTQTLYYVSFFGKTLLKYVESSHFQSKLDGMPTFIIPIEGQQNHFAVGLDRKVVEVEWPGGDDTAKVIRTIAEVDSEHPDTRLNHGKADPRGRLFAGTIPTQTNSKINQGSLYRFEEDGTPHKVVEGIGVANGFCWDIVDKAFYFIDNFNYSIRRYDYDVESGDISNPQIVFTMQDHEYILMNTEHNKDGDVQTDLDSSERYVKSLIEGVHKVGRQGDRPEYEDGDPQDFDQNEKIESHDVDEGGLLDYTQVGRDYVESDTEYGRRRAFQGLGPSGPGGQAADDHQGYAAPGPQDFAQGGPQDFTPGGPQDFATDGPQDFAPGSPQDFATDGPQDFGPGQKGHKKTVLKKLPGILDGMTIDTDGNLWVANYNGSQVLKIEPKKGKLLQVVRVPAPLVTAATFGEPGLGVLYVTSAAVSPARELQHSPAGATFAVSYTGARGHPNNKVRFNHPTMRKDVIKEDAT